MCENALFLAERLYYSLPNEENLLLMARCYVHDKEWKKTQLLLKGCCSPSCRYLLSLSLFHLGELNEAERILFGKLTPFSDSASLSDHKKGKLLTTIPEEEVGLYLLGQICRKGGRIEMAAQYFSLCLEVFEKNSFLIQNCGLILSNN